MSKKNDALTYEDYVQGIDNLETEQQLSLVELLSVKLKKQFESETCKHKITELEGLGEGVWNKIDVSEYLRKERNSWG